MAEEMLEIRSWGHSQPMASLEGWGGPAPGDTLQGGDTRRKKNLWANLQRIVEKLVEKWGRTGKKIVGWHPGGGDTQVKAIKSYSDSDSDKQKNVTRFFRKN